MAYLGISKHAKVIWNFLTDVAENVQHPHLQVAVTLIGIQRQLSVPQGRLVKIGRSPSRMAANPVAQLIQVNGFIVDARHMPGDLPEAAVRLD